VPLSFVVCTFAKTMATATALDLPIISTNRCKTFIIFINGLRSPLLVPCVPFSILQSQPLLGYPHLPALSVFTGFCSNVAVCRRPFAHRDSFCMPPWPRILDGTSSAVGTVTVPPLRSSRAPNPQANPTERKMNIK